MECATLDTTTLTATGMEVRAVMLDRQYVHSSPRGFVLLVLVAKRLIALFGWALRPPASVV